VYRHANRKEKSMKSYKPVFGLLGAFCLLTVAAPILRSQEKVALAAVQVHLVITNEAVRGDSEVPSFESGDVKVKQGKTFLKVNQLIRAQGDNAALQRYPGFHQRSAGINIGCRRVHVECDRQHRTEFHLRP
jgi:hypothetical protein